MGSNQSRVFVTGSAVLSGQANRVSELWALAVAGKKSPGDIPGDSELAGRIGLPPGDASILARHQILALAVADQAWQTAGLGNDRNRLRGEGEKRKFSRFGCVGGSSLGGLVALEQDFAAKPDNRFSPYALSRWRGNSVSAVVALRHGLSGTVLAPNAASATGAQILWMAGTLIRSGLADAIVAVAADPAPSCRVAKAMGRNRSVAKDEASEPLSGSRSGMNPCEGAACLILESEAHASARNAHLLAEWIGGECHNESHHLQAPDPTGKTLEEMIRGFRDGILPKGRDLDWISLHATGTSRYDAIESSVIRRIYGDTLPWISAFKRTTGHALSASGLLEAALLVEGLSSGKVPPPLSGVDEALGLTIPGEAASPPAPQTAMQIGQGMGGDVVVNLLSRVEFPLVSDVRR